MAASQPQPPLSHIKVEPAVAALLKTRRQVIVQIRFSNSAMAFIRKMRRAGYGRQFLDFSVVVIHPLLNALGKEIGSTVISLDDPSPGNIGILLIKQYQQVIGPTDQIPGYESIEAYAAARAVAEGMRRSVETTGKADWASVLKTLGSMSDYGSR